MVTVSKVLNNAALNKLQLKVNNADLTQRVGSITVLDYEFDQGNNEFGIILKHDFILSSFIVAKNDEELLYTIIKKLIDSGASALAIKNIYYKEIPNKVIKLAQRHRFPIFLFDSATYYEDIIYAVMKEIEINNKHISYEKIIDKILRDHYTNEEIKMTINLSDDDYYIFIINSKNTLNLSKFDNNKIKFTLLNYYNSTFIICTKQFDIAYYIKFFDDIIDGEYFIGLGKLLDNYTISFKTAINSLKIAMHKQVKFVENYQKSYVSAIIDNYQSTEQLNFMDNYLGPILDDEELLTLLACFIENKGDMIACSIEQYTHINTIRYRIEKIRKLIDPGSCMFEFKANAMYALTIYELNNTIFPI